MTQEALKKADFKCQKCGYYSPIGKDLEINKINNTVLCTICNKFAPNSDEDFKQYINNKIDWHALEDFRKFHKSKSQSLKQGMQETAKKGKHVSRPAFGYKV
jgi:hypothetical protein